MTNAVVWLEEGTSKVWAVADSLITAGAGSTVRRVTDQAMKLMRLSVGAWGSTDCTVAGGPAIGYDVGMDRPGFRRHLVAIIHGNKRGVYEQQQAVHG